MTVVFEGNSRLDCENGFTHALGASADLRPEKGPSVARAEAQSGVQRALNSLEDHSEREREGVEKVGNVLFLRTRYIYP